MKGSTKALILGWLESCFSASCENFVQGTLVYVLSARCNIMPASVVLTMSPVRAAPSASGKVSARLLRSRPHRQKLKMIPGMLRTPRSNKPPMAAKENSAQFQRF